MKDGSFVKVNRSFFAGDLWRRKRTYSEAEAWIDMLQCARFGQSGEITYINNREVEFERAQFPASQGYLAQRWGWTEKVVRTFLGRLRRKRMIDISTLQGISLITICGYDEGGLAGGASGGASGGAKGEEVGEVNRLSCSTLTPSQGEPEAGQRAGCGRAKGENKKKEQEEGKEEREKKESRGLLDNNYNNRLKSSIDANNNLCSWMNLACNRLRTGSHEQYRIDQKRYGIENIKRTNHAEE